MGVEIEVQEQSEFAQIKSRELQIENTEKLNNLIPVVEAINEVNLSQIESNTNEIKTIVNDNLNDQPNLEDVLEAVDKLNKNISSLKGQVTKLSKKVEGIEGKIQEV